MKRIAITLAAGLALALWAATGVAGDKLPVPPRFDSDAGRLEILKAYPLGVITQQAAFSHHGKADLEVELPNGLEGWVYQVGGTGRQQTYQDPAGKEREVTETRHGRGARLYTLVFGPEGRVVDVLYNEHGRHDGLSAAAAQNDIMQRVMESDPGRGKTD